MQQERLLCILRSCHCDFANSTSTVISRTSKVVIDRQSQAHWKKTVDKTFDNKINYVETDKSAILKQLSISIIKLQGISNPQAGTESPQC